MRSSTRARCAAQISIVTDSAPRVNTHAADVLRTATLLALSWRDTTSFRDGMFIACGRWSSSTLLDRRVFRRDRVRSRLGPHSIAYLRHLIHLLTAKRSQPRFTQPQRSRPCCTPASCMWPSSRADASNHGPSLLIPYVARTVAVVHGAGVMRCPAHRAGSLWG